MSTQTLTAWSTNGPNNSQTGYCAAFNGGRGVAWAASDLAKHAASVMPTAGSLSLFRVDLPAAPGDGKSWAFTLCKNGSPTDLTVTISGSATSGQDTTHSAAVSIGDYFTVKAVPSNSPTNTTPYWAAVFTPTTDDEFVFGGDTGGSSCFGNGYFPLGHGGEESTESRRQIVVPCAGIIKSLYIAVETAPGAGDHVTLTARKNGVDQTLVATVTDAATTNQDTTHSFSVVAGDLLSFNMTDVDELPRISWSFVFVPSTAGHVPMLSANLGTIDSVGYHSVDGQAREVALQTPVLFDMTAEALYVAINTAPAAGKSRTVTLQKNTSDTELAVTLSEGVTAGNDSGSVSLTAGDMLRISHSSSGSPAATYGSVSVLATVSSVAPPYDDGTPDGGIVFGGEVVEVGTSNYADGTPVGGIVMGGPAGSEFEPEENHQVDEECFGGITFDGGVAERWYNPWAVAVKGGTYRIGGEIYTLDEDLYYEGLGTIAAIVGCDVPPAVAGRFRYDLLSIDDEGTITVTAGTEATTPVMPSTPSGEIKLDHVLRYYGQTSIIQADIGKLWTAPVLTTLEISVDDDELAWAETDTDITITCRDQYGQLYTGNKVINAAITTGNGTISPASRSGSASSFTFNYERDGEVTDVSPLLTFSTPTGAFVTVYIRLLNADGELMT